MKLWKWNHFISGISLCINSASFLLKKKREFENNKCSLHDMYLLFTKWQFSVELIIVIAMYTITKILDNLQSVKR